MSRNELLLLLLIIPIIMGVVMKRIGLAISTVGIGAAIAVITQCRNDVPLIPLYSAVGLLAFAGITALIYSLNLIIRDKQFNDRLVNYITRGKSLYKKRNLHDISSNGYMAETQKLINEITNDLSNNRRKAEVDRVVGGLKFNLDDLNSVNESLTEKHKKGQIGNAISSLVDNLIELQEREKKD